VTTATSKPPVEEALRDLSEVRLVCLQALGMKPQRGANDGHEDDEDED
jgi:hypothetical protein